MLSDEPADGLSLLVPVALFPTAVFGLPAVVQQRGEGTPPPYLDVETWLHGQIQTVFK